MRMILAVIGMTCPCLGYAGDNGDGVVERWTVTELGFQSPTSYDNPYTDVDFWAIFESEEGQTLKRPGYWDGGSTWKIRFAPPAEGDRWRYRTYSSDAANTGLHGQRGALEVVDYAGDNPLLLHGLLGMSDDHRNVVHADGTPFLLVGDTPWALPFRGTPESVAVYARNRQERGFNAVLLMSVQPDRRAEGPRDRSLPRGFGVAFEDLAQGSLEQLDPRYFREFDALVRILIDHGIVPVYSPVFQGFGWKGLGALGDSADPDQYVRYVRYLIARYGAWPAMWLVSADASGRGAVVEPAGEAFEDWDAYQQPAGIHYSPYDDRLASWTDDPVHGRHHNRVHQDKEWLDFQWAQTGHNAEHKPEKVATMWKNRPPKGVANGEPTYENMSGMGRAAGWWQGHEAWLNLVHGGTLGVVYGAGGLWNWKLSADEAGWPDWANTPASWRDAIGFDGARYVGYVSRAFQGMPFKGMAPQPDLADGHNLLAVPGLFYLSYLPEGGTVSIVDIPPGLPYRWFNPQSGAFAETGTTGATAFTAPDANPWVLVVGRAATLRHQQ